MSGGSQGSGSPNQLGGAGQMNYMANGPGSGGAFTSTPPSATQTPQWLRGLALGQQLSQQGQQMAQMGQQHPMPPPMQRAPGMIGGPQGMQQGVVPGSQPQMPMGPGMASGGLGMQQQGQMPGGINPQLLQMLMRSR